MNMGNPTTDRLRTANVNTPPAAERDVVVIQTPAQIATRRTALLKIQQIIYLILGVMEGLITIRFLLRLFAANPAAGFAQFIYGVTGPMLFPFYGLFPTPQFEGSVMEVISIVAMLVYALLAWLVIRIMWLLFEKSRPAA